jgi:hypothetical protein
VRFNSNSMLEIPRMEECVDLYIESALVRNCKWLILMFLGQHPY